MAIRTILALALAGGLSQTDQDARALLQGVVNASKALTTLRAEGRIDQDLDLGFGGGTRTLRFRVATRDPRQARIEISGGEKWMTGLPYLAVCRDGGGWLYLEKSKGYERMNAEDAAEYCEAGMLTDFSHVADDMTSAAVIGLSRARFEGRDQTCTDVEAHYRVVKDLMVPPGMILKLGRVTRRMCIDRTRNLILRDRFEADTDAGPDRYHIVQTVTYDRIDRNPTLPVSLFDFQPPRNARLYQEPAPPLVAPLPSVPPGQRVRTMATPIERKEPEYTQEAWDEGIQGSVVLLVDVGENGAIGEIRTHQGLGYGLDEKAIEAVRSWRFNPATDNGRPIKGTERVELRFTLPDQRPAGASVAPVTRPIVSPRLPSVRLRASTDLEDFLYLIAENFKAPQVCDRISPSAEGGGGGGWSERGFQISSMRSDCYRNLAWELHDPQLCDQAIAVRTATLDGSRMDKAYCLNGVNGKGWGEVESPHAMQPFVRYMRLLGYDDARVAAGRYDESPENSETYAAYERLRTDQTFIERLRTGPDFFEPPSADKLRPARAVEFLYQMVAIDTADASLCAKVSPNATFTDLGHHKALLRSRCFAAIAYNTKSDMLCAQLPRIGTFPHINQYGYDSLEGCEKMVAIYRRPNFNSGGIRYGPSAFPRPSDFQDALRQIGYPQDARSRVPAPTPDDYWQFLLRMKYQGSDDDRRELLRKVMALR